MVSGISCRGSADPFVPGHLRTLPGLELSCFGHSHRSFAIPSSNHRLKSLVSLCYRDERVMKTEHKTCRQSVAAINEPLKSPARLFFTSAGSRFSVRPSTQGRLEFSDRAMRRRCRHLRVTEFLIASPRLEMSLTRPESGTYDFLIGTKYGGAPQVRSSSTRSNLSDGPASSDKIDLRVIRTTN